MTRKMADSDEDYLDSAQMQSILLEAASDWARRGRHGQVCSSASSHYVPNHADERLQKEYVDYESEDSHHLRRSNSSPAIPELGRQIFQFQSAVPGDDPSPPRPNVWRDAQVPGRYHLQGSFGHHPDNVQRIYNDVRERRERRAPLPTYTTSRTHGVGCVEPSRDQSSEDSYEVIDLETAEEQYDLQQYANVRRSPVQQYRHYEHSGMKSPTRYEYESEEEYLEESPLPSCRPIIRILNEGDTGGETHRSDPGPLGYNSHPYTESWPSLGHKEALAEAEKHIAHLNAVVYRIKDERNDLMEVHRFRSEEWMEVKNRMYGEIVDLRDQNTALMNDKIVKGGKLSKTFARSLLKAKQESDRALMTTLERQHKINELRLLVTMQQRYIIGMEETLQEYQIALAELRSRLPEVPQDFVNKCLDMPMRRTTEEQVPSGYQDIIGCDRANYIPGVSTDPELSAVEVFNFPGDAPVLSQKLDMESFDMMKVPYVRGALSSIA